MYEKGLPGEALGPKDAGVRGLSAPMGEGTLLLAAAGEPEAAHGQHDEHEHVRLRHLVAVRSGTFAARPLQRDRVRDQVRLSHHAVVRERCTERIEPHQGDLTDRASDHRGLPDHLVIDEVFEHTAAELEAESARVPDDAPVAECAVLVIRTVPVPEGTGSVDQSRVVAFTETGPKAASGLTEQVVDGEARHTTRQGPAEALPVGQVIRRGGVQTRDFDVERAVRRQDRVRGRCGGCPVGGLGGVAGIRVEEDSRLCCHPPQKERADKQSADPMIHADLQCGFGEVPQLDGDYAIKI